MKSLLSILIALLLFSCSRPSVTGVESMKWAAADPSVDSLTEVLERMFYDVAPDGDIIVAIDRLPLMAKDKPAPLKREISARWHYWKGRLFRSMTMTDSAQWHINKAEAAVDSNAYYYTFRRIKTIAKSMQPDMADGYLRSLLDDINYYAGIGDDAMQASVAILIGNTLSDSYQHDSALEYYMRADSLHRLLGLNSYIAKNSINIASCLHNMGRQKESMGIIRKLLNDSTVAGDFFAYNTVLRNAYIYTKDKTYLQRAYDRTMAYDSTLALNGVFEYLFNLHYLRNAKDADTLLADRYAEKAFARINEESDPSIKAAIYLAKSEQMDHAGNKDSAYYYLKRHLMLTDTINTRRQPSEVAKIHNMQVIAQNESERNDIHHSYVVRILVLIIILVATAGAAAFVILHIKERHKLKEQEMQMEKIRSELDIERYQKQMLAISLSMEATDRNLTEIRDKIRQLQVEGKVSSEEMQRIDTVIKSHMSDRDDFRQFIALFEKAHPHFISNLKGKYPSLSDSQMKLAVYIYTGMPNKQIAGLLNIRAESVKQARWRLRSKMGLGANDSLEDALRALAR